MRLYTESGFGKESKQRSRRLVEESREAVFLTTPKGTSWTRMGDQAGHKLVSGSEGL
jgi:hypothetical protein